MKKTLGLLAIVTVGLLVALRPFSNQPTVEDFKLDPSLQRVRFSPAPSTLMTIAGGDWVEGRLYLLDAMRSEVVVVEEGAAGWTEVLAFGGEGGGPGELRSPMDVLWLPGPEEVVVITADLEAHFFTRDGTFLRVEALRLPCTLGRRRLTLRAPDEFWVSGNCAFPSPGNDTVFAVAAGRDASGAWTNHRQKPRYTLAGSFGTPFGLQNPTIGGEGPSFLNAGNDLCFARAGDAPGQQEKELCLAGDRYSAPVPADFEAPRGRSSALFTWPDPLPAVSEAGVAEDHLFLLRMYSADSIFVETHPLSRPEGRGRLLAGGPFEGLVSCRSFGCLWYIPDVSGDRIGVLHFSDLLAPTDDHQAEGD